MFQQMIYFVTVFKLFFSWRWLRWAWVPRCLITKLFFCFSFSYIISYFRRLVRELTAQSQYFVTVTMKLLLVISLSWLFFVPYKCFSVKRNLFGIVKRTIAYFLVSENSVQTIRQKSKIFVFTTVRCLLTFNFRILAFFLCQRSSNL